MSAIARRFKAIPARSAIDTWSAIMKILAPDSTSDGGRELRRVTSAACAMIAERAMEKAPIICSGAGPRVRIYCLYDDDALESEAENESELSFVATDGDWQMSLPCPGDDLPWIQRLLASVSVRVTARDLATGIELPEPATERASTAPAIDLKGFLKQ